MALLFGTTKTDQNQPSPMAVSLFMTDLVFTKQHCIDFVVTYFFYYVYLLIVFISCFLFSFDKGRKGSFIQRSMQTSPIEL